MNGLSLEDLPLGAALLSADRRVVEANAAVDRLLGHPPGGLLGRSLVDLLVAPDGAEPRWFRDWHPSARLPSVRGFPEHDVTLRRADGTTVTTAVAGRYRRDAQGHLIGVLVTVRPGPAAGSAAIEVVSTVSHELRSPLTSVKGYTSLLLNRWERIPDDQKRAMLEQINADADRVTRLVTELLDISRLEAGRLTLRRQDVDMVELTRSIVAKLTIVHADLDVTVDFPPGFPTVYCDPDKIEQVLTNLVENAAKYADPTGMRIEGTVADGEVAVTVTDVGPGIPAADLPRVFTRFFRRDHGRPTGSGLGLWISRGLVEAHDGRLTATSIEGQGSSFRFTLPADAFERLHR